ncbi:MAG: right-handed parallel beta-helix repeat-containing protein [Deltaproteobacteria bacterium]|nr:right-handed parallel beta-helix repeat-containing protein [Deltaproteobacteria bacterium]
MEIQSALDECKSTGGKVVLLAGDYYVSAALRLYGGYHVLEGESILACIHLTNGANSDIIAIGISGQTTNFAHIKRLHLDGNRANQTGTSHVIEASGDTLSVGGVVIEDVEIEGAHDEGIYLHDAVRTAFLRHVGVYLCGADGMATYARRVDMVDVELNNNDRYGLYVLEGTVFAAKGSIDGNGQFGAVIFAEHGGGIYDFDVSGNSQSHANDYDGILLTHANGFQVAGCYFSQTVATGPTQRLAIYIDPDCSWTRVQACVMSGMLTGDIYDAGTGSYCQLYEGLIASKSIIAEQIADGAIGSPHIEAVDSAADGEALTYDAASGKFEWKSVAGVTKHTELTDKEVGGVIDHADGSVTDAKIVGVSGAKVSGNIPGEATATEDHLTTHKTAATIDHPDGSVTAAKIADGAVGSPQIAAGAIKPGHLDAIDSPADGEALTYDAATGRHEWAVAGVSKHTDLTDKEVAGVIDHADKSVTAAKIADGAVGSPQIALSAVKSGHIADGEVGSPEIALDAIRAGHILDGEVGSPEIALGAVKEGHLAAGAVTGTKIADGAVGSPKIGDGEVTDAKLASGVGLSDGQIAKLPTATEGQALVRGAAAWGAGDVGVSMHGADKHTNVTRTLFVPPSETYTGNATYEAYWPVIALAAGSTQNVRFIFRVPSDFVSFTSLKVLWSGSPMGTAGQDWVADALAKYAAAGEGTGQHTDDPSSVTIDVPALATFYETDVGLTMSNLAKGDYVTVQLERLGGDAADTFGYDIAIYGLLLTYTAEQ